MKQRMKLYVAYGSNLNKEQMKYRCPDSKVYATGVIEDYELQFKGRPNGAFATIAPKQGALNKLNTINAYALAGLKKPKISDWKINENTSFSSASPAITFILDTTNSLATKP